MNKKWSNKIVLAIGLAITADLIQFALGAAELTGFLFLPAEIFDVFMDCALAVILSILIGFHVLLLPTMFAEFIPVISLFPTWTCCTLFVIRQKHKAAIHKNLVVEVEQLKATGLPPVLLPAMAQKIPRVLSAATELQLLKSANPMEKSHEEKLQTALDYFNKGLISQSELDAKRREILAEI